MERSGNTDRATFLSQSRNLWREIEAAFGSVAMPDLQGRSNKTNQRNVRTAKVLVLYKKPKCQGFRQALHFGPYSAGEENSRPKEIRHQHRRGGDVCPQFDSLDALKTGMGWPEGKAGAGDLANFADGRVELYPFDTKEV